MRDTGERGGQVRKSEGLSHLQALSPELAETCSHHSPRGETILPTCQAFLRYSHGHQPWSIWEENGRGREASVLHPRSHLRGRALFPQSQLERDEEGTDWEFGISRCRLLYVEWINNKVLLYSTGNYSQYLVKKTIMKKNIEKYIYLCITELPCCIAEINTAL